MIKKMEEMMMEKSGNEKVSGLRVVPTGMVADIVAGKAGGNGGCCGMVGKNGEADDCVNLRPAVGGEVVALGSPKVLAVGDYKPLIVINIDRLIASCGTTLVEVSDGEVKVIGELPSVAKCATSMGNVVTVMTERGPYLIELDEENDEWIAYGLLPKFPEVSLRANEMADYQENVNARKLSTKYTTADKRLTVSDIKSISEDMISAYKALDAQIKVDGYVMQPVMARYKIKDRRGNVLFKSAPVLLGTANGLQCCGAVSMSSSDGQTIDEYALTAKGYRIEAVMQEKIASPWDKIAESIEVEISDQMHVLDDGATMSYNMSGRNNNDTFIVAHVPGSVEYAGSVYKQQVNKLIDRMEMITASTVALNISEIALGEAIEIKRDKVDIDEEVATMAKAVKTSVSNTIERAKLSSPHTFTASGVSSNGVTTVWIKPQQLRWDGYGIKMFSNTADEGIEGKWKAAIIVEFNDGERVVRESTGTGKMSTTLGALISYPAGDAVKMTIMMSSNGKTYKKALNLQQSQDRMSAYYLNQQGRGIELEEVDEDYLVPSEKKVSQKEIQTEVAVTKAGNVNEVLLAEEVSTGKIEAIAPLSHTISSWDVVRSRYHVFGRSGIYALAINQDCTKITSQLLDERPVASKAVVSSGRGTMVVSDGELLTINNSQVKSEVIGINATAVGWSGKAQELWMSSDDGRTLVANYGDSKETKYYWRGERGISEMITAGGELYGSDGEKLMKLSEETDSEVEVKWSGIIKLMTTATKAGRKTIPRIQAVSIDMRSAKYDGTIAIDEDVLKINGAIKSEISADIYNRPRKESKVEFSGETNSGTKIKELSIWISKKS